MQVPKRRSEQSRKREEGPFYITAAGLEALKEEMANLRSNLPEMIKEVERTKAHGDFSENAAYQDAKATLRRTHGRIASLEDRIKRAILIKTGAREEVQIGSKVLVESNGKRMTFEILGSHESDPSKGRISNASPLGKALIGCRVGEVAELCLNQSVMLYKIQKIM